MVKMLSEDELARACSDVMWANDKASQNLGMNIEFIANGRADISMRVSELMLNGHDTCHGGYIFTLADSAFAFACNSHNQLTVAQQCSISFVNPAQLGDVLTASAEERILQGRSGIYDVTVKDQNDRTIAEFRGASRTIKGSHLPEYD